MSPAPTASNSFYQLAHQGTKLIPCDLIGFSQAPDTPDGHQDLLIANLFAQAEALAFGKTADDLAAEGSPAFQTPFRVSEGDRPTNVILAERLTPRILGSLIAMYEHSVFTQGVIWGIDSFDQWGVELTLTPFQKATYPAICFAASFGSGYVHAAAPLTVSPTTASW